MRIVEVVSTGVRGGADPGARARAVEFVRDVATATGARPISDHLWLDLRNPEGDGPILTTAADDDGLLAMAQISRGNDSWSIEAFARPDVADARSVVFDVAETAIDRFRDAGGGRLSWWVDDPDVADERFAASQGLEPVRALHEMRRPLPHELHAEIGTRAFRPGVDDEAWLEVNNRAFAGHDEQGGWTVDTLARRVAEPWFDPDGFRLYEIDDRLAGFCWTKLHHDTDPTLGEIYVIGVDPDFQGRGLGKQLTLAGLDSITARGVSLADLYVDADNAAAVGLYDRLGFTVHRTRRAFAGDLPPARRSDEEST